jgi:hypothetical protein
MSVPTSGTTILSGHHSRHNFQYIQYFSWKSPVSQRPILDKSPDKSPDNSHGARIGFAGAGCWILASQGWKVKMQITGSAMPSSKSCRHFHNEQNSQHQQNEFARPAEGSGPNPTL